MNKMGRKKLTPEEKFISAEKRKACWKARSATPEAKAYQKAYHQAYHQAYNATPKIKAYQKAYKKAHKEEEKAYYANQEGKARQKARNARPEAKATHKAYCNNLENKTKFKKYQRVHRMKKYGLTPEQYNEMLIKQNNCCAICGRNQSELKQVLAVDHNHKTGKVRGLVCFKCNSGVIAYFDNNSVSIMKLASYFKRDEEDKKLSEFLNIIK
jgi:hypothetical protein